MTTGKCKANVQTRPYTRLLQSCAGGQGQYKNTLTKHLGRGSNAKIAHKHRKSNV